MEAEKVIKKLHYNSPVILSFAFISLLSLIIGYATQDKSTMLLFSVYRSSPASIFFYFRLIGHIFGHANFGHYINNFIIILLVGPMLEEKYGSKKLASMIAITAVVTGFINIALFNTALLGASGIAFMLILLSSYVNIQKGKIPLTLVLVIIAYLGREIFSGVFSSDNISQLTHIAGGVCGGVFGHILNNKSNV